MDSATNSPLTRIAIIILCTISMFIFSSCLSTADNTSIKDAIATAIAFKDNADYEHMKEMPTASVDPKKEILATAGGTDNLSYYIMSNRFPSSSYEIFPCRIDNKRSTEIEKVATVFMNRAYQHKSLLTFAEVRDYKFITSADNTIDGYFKLAVEGILKGRCLFKGTHENNKIVITKLCIAKKNSDNFEDGLLVFNKEQSKTSPASSSETQGGEITGK